MSTGRGSSRTLRSGSRHLANDDVIDPPTLEANQQTSTSSTLSNTAPALNSAQALGNDEAIGLQTNLQIAQLRNEVLEERMKLAEERTARANNQARFAEQLAERLQQQPTGHGREHMAY